ncbi:MAG: glycosyltransferase [Candidatus Neomarinimicrobiota bacterium]
MIHIVLCNLMEEKLRVYRKNISCILLSNSAFSTDKNNVIFTNRRLKTIGFLGNVSFKKGINIFFKVLEKLTFKRPIYGIIGGPFQDHKSANFTRNELKQHSFISYLGPIYDNDKEKFFNTIDLLLMPSILEEAEPFVINEAMSYGIPVIAYNKGCIAEIVKQDSGLVVELNVNFTNYAAKIINNWIDNPKIFNQIRTNVYNSYKETRKKSKATLEHLISQIVNITNN